MIAEYDLLMDYVEHPVLIVPDPSGLAICGGARHNNEMVYGWPMHFPFMSMRVFLPLGKKDTDIDLRVRMQMARVLRGTGLFDKIIVQPSPIVGWLPVIFTLNYEDGIPQHKGILTYPHT